MKALLVSNTDSLLAQLSFLCASRAAPIILSRVAGGLSQVAAHICDEVPDLLIVEDANFARLEMGLLEGLNAQYPHMAIMLLSADQSQQMLLQAMRAGVRELVPLPLDLPALGDALDRIEHKTMAATRNGRIVSFIPCKGGSGATFIATNFAYAMAAQAKKRVMLIDLNQQFGDAALYISDKKPVTTLSDVCAQINRVDAAFLESSLIEVTPDFGILAASEDPVHAGAVKPEHIDAILHIARNYYDYVILDVGRQIDAVTIRALDQSDMIHPVLQLTMPCLRDAGRLLEVFRSLGYGREKTTVIVNRYEKSGELRLADVEAATGGCSVLTLPNNHKAVAESINQGVPVLQLARNSPVAKALLSLVNQTVGRPAAKEWGFIGRLFSNRVQALTAPV